MTSEPIGSSEAEQWRLVNWPWREYHVSNLGNFRGPIGPMKLNPDKTTGYVKVNLAGSGRQTSRGVHTLVAEAFLGPRPLNLVVAHLNGKRADNRLENLMYATTAENYAHSVGHGTANHGENNALAKLNNEAVQDILSRRETATAAAERYGVHVVNIHAVRRGKAWKHIHLATIARAEAAEARVLVLEEALKTSREGLSIAADLIAVEREAWKARALTLQEALADIAGKADLAASTCDNEGRATGFLIIATSARAATAQ